MELVSLTSEGKILLTLKHGKHTYGELRYETMLSDRWLTNKLKELKGKQWIKKDGKWYGLKRELMVSPYELSSYMTFHAKRIARKLAQLNIVRAVILFGGVAKKTAHEYSDLDMIIVVSELPEDTKKDVISKISQLELKHHLIIEPLILTEEDFLDNIHTHEGGIVYGIAEGFEVLVDKTDKLTEILHDRIRKITRTHEHLKEEGIWLKVK